MGESLIQRATRDVTDAQAHSLTQTEVTAVRDVLGKCINPLTGEPVTARREDTAVYPVSGSVTASADGHGRGTCPHCGAHVALSGKGFITSHTVRRTPVPVAPPAVRLVERQAEVTDTGSRVGSPDAAMRTRTAELSGASGTGTVPVRAKVVGGQVKARVKDPVTRSVSLVVVERVAAEAVPGDGDAERARAQTVQVPATEANVRTALRQEMGKRTPDQKMIARLKDMLRGVTGTAAVPVLGAEPGTYRVREAVTLDALHAGKQGRDESLDADRPNAGGHVPTVPGAALVQGRSMPAVEPKREGKNGKPRNAAGWSEPVGRVRMDRLISLGGDPEACKGADCTIAGCVAIVGGRHGYLECHVFRALSPSRRRRYWGHVRRNQERAAAARQQVRAQAARVRAEVARLRELGAERS